MLEEAGVGWGLNVKGESCDGGAGVREGRWERRLLARLGGIFLGWLASHWDLRTGRYQTLCLGRSPCSWPPADLLILKIQTTSQLPKTKRLGLGCLQFNVVILLKFSYGEP